MSGDKLHVHITSLQTYLAVFGALLFLTLLTVAVTWVDLGFLNVPIAVGLATIKAALVALIFMHLLYDEKFNIVVFASSLLFLLIFIAFTLIDPVTRGQNDPIERFPVNPPPVVESKVHDEGYGGAAHGEAGKAEDAHSEGGH